ncbi:leucine-rich repeat domain-containing protein [Tenacibaculum sp. Ill]|uniref:leucine-rich repeat domain-containing protein n=1 Tax=Tenacibaculum sp. Ill TaxID=3445935 RepID=UPI003F7AB2C0
MKRLLLFTLVLFGVYVNAQEISQSDKDALIAFYNATDGANWTNKWDLNDSPQNWYGVKTNVVFGASGAERHVDEINLPNNNLVGTLPSELGSLKSLNLLNLSNNSISGAIPGGLGSAKDLNYLYLQNNQLSGDIPVELFTLTERHFVEINLSSNLLTGKLPVEIGNAIANVGDVYVSNNLLTDLPDYTASTLFRINTLDISNNNIPFAVFERASSFDNIAKVLEDNVATLTYSPQNKINEEENIVFEEGTNVSFSVTGLSSTNNTYQWFKNGASITGATSATYQITSASLADAGTYYCEIQNSSVPNLTLKRNNIVYRTVESINDKNALIALYNATNGVNWTDSWDLNEDISTWKGVTVNTAGRVTELNLSNRGLNGTLPVEIGNLSELKRFWIQGGLSDTLTGNIPSTICNLLKLEHIIISKVGNGIIPSCLFTIPSLKIISISGKAGNSPTLDIPDDLSSLTNLTNLSLKYVDLSSEGDFPTSFFQLTNLERLSLDTVSIKGSFPVGLSSLTKLRYLDISGNITGNIPDEIGELTNLKTLSIRNTPLTGLLPTSIGNLTNLQGLTIVGTAIEGGIPASFSNLTSLTTLNLSRNKLTEQVPSFINTFSALSFLSLRENNFSGLIPDFTVLKGLQTLEIQNNNFVFNDFENEFTTYKISIPTRFTYKPQFKIDIKQNITVVEEESITLTAESTNSVNNTYQWRKDGVNIADATSRSYVINSTALTDGGVYDCVINNTIITDLTLYKNTIILNVEPKDSDNDGVDNDKDLCPNTPTGESVNADGCSDSQLDDDNDGVNNDKDLCPNTPTGELVNADGCSESQLDDDNDGVNNDKDLCPNTPTGELVNADGCSESQLDNDNDGVNNDKDLCPNTPTGESVNADGCSESQLDDDKDGVNNDKDLCPNTPTGKLVNADGCSESQLDDDKDGVNNDKDLCPNTPTGESVNVDGCSDSQLDDDNDGVNNAIDLCLNTPIGAIVNEKGCSENNSDKEALIALYNATDGVNWTETWDLNAQMSTWKGVVLDTYGNVTKLDLYFNNLVGTLPPEIGNLTNLTFLNISSNKLTGEIPTQIGNLIKLKELSISNNQLSGVIPKEIGKLTLLERLSLGSNQLTGAIPIEVTNLTKLRDLHLSQNQLSGEIPKEIGKLTFLEKLSLYTNQLIGEIPLEIGNLTNLTYLNIANNKLTGAIPKSIGNLIKIQNISIGTNQLTGEIPQEIGNLTNLRFLYLFNNQLTGEIPSEIGNLVSLDYISLKSNNLTGIIPAELGNLINLKFLILEKNKLFGSIPSGIENLVKLRWLSLAENELTGIIPIEIGNLINLEYLKLDKNNLSGPIPSEFGNLNKLESAYLRENQLSGKIPSTIKDMDSLDILVIENNNFVFEDLEDEFSLIMNKLKHYVYDSQAHLDVSKEITVKQNESITFSVEGTSSPNNIYTWRLNGKNILNTKDKTFTISKADIDDNGVYDCLITNSVVTNLGLFKKPITLNVEIIDVDNDGVNDDIDQCPNTVEGSVVDANGCAQYQLIDIAPSDIQVMVSSTTCPDKSNGVVNLSFNKDYTYKVILVGQGVINKTFDNVNHTSGLEITELPVGSYEICVTASELPSFSQCYNVMVSAPAALKVSQTSLKGTSLTYQVSGSENYKVTVNNKEYLYTFKDAGKQEIIVNLDNGNNSVEITTNKPCQGIYNKSVTIKGITLYPIPVTNYLNISGVTDNSAIVIVRSLEGATVLSTKLDVYNGVAKLPMNTIATGMYLVTVTTSTQTVNTKIFKK